MSRPREDERPVVHVPQKDHQPTKAEMEQDMSVDATPEAVARALVTPVRVRTYGGDPPVAKEG